MKMYTDYQGQEHAALHPENFSFGAFPGDGYNGYQRMKCKQCGIIIVQVDKSIKTRNTIQTAWALEHFVIIEWP